VGRLIVCFIGLIQVAVVAYFLCHDETDPSDFPSRLKRPSAPERTLAVLGSSVGLRIPWVQKIEQREMLWQWVQELHNSDPKLLYGYSSMRIPREADMAWPEHAESETIWHVSRVKCIKSLGE
jgi:hypothetical protein